MGEDQKKGPEKTSTVGPGNKIKCLIEKTSTVGPGNTIIPGSSTKKNGSNGQDVIPGSSTKKDGSNGQDGSNEDKKSTTTASSAMVHLFEQSLVIMMIMAITISFIFNNFL